MDASASTRARAVEYPERDGKPMAESDDHRDETQHYGIDVLEDRYEDEPMVYVSGNNFVYYTEGSPGDCVSPDVYVVKGAPAGRRRVFKAWEEGGRLPCFVLEITSRSTRRDDLGEKMTKYRDELGVPEYFLFDPHGEWIPERLRGFVLKDGTYHPIEPNSAGRLVSHELGLELGVQDGHLRFYLPGTSEPLPTRMERSVRAEAQVRRLQAEIERLKGR